MVTGEPHLECDIIKIISTVVLTVSFHFLYLYQQHWQVKQILHFHFALTHGHNCAVCALNLHICQGSQCSIVHSDRQWLSLRSCTGFTTVSLWSAHNAHRSLHNAQCRSRSTVQFKIRWLIGIVYSAHKSSHKLWWRNDKYGVHWCG